MIWIIHTGFRVVLKYIYFTDKEEFFFLIFTSSWVFSKII